MDSYYVISTWCLNILICQIHVLFETNDSCVVDG